MYYVTKTMEIAGAHSLTLSYPSKCSRLHGHNWLIKVHCKARTLNVDGMVADFSRIKELVHDRLDHSNLNEIMPFNPTAENLARWIVDTVPTCFRADVRESDGNTATYIDETMTDSFDPQ